MRGFCTLLAAPLSRQQEKIGVSERRQESVRDDRADPLSHVEEDDDPPMLSLQALEALKELLAKQNRTLVTDSGTSAGDGASEDGVALVTEDWRLRQFWYDRETAETVAREVHTLCTSTDSPSVACIACPTLYAYLKELPSSLKHAYRIVVADPPYLSKECLDKVARTISFLMQPGEP